MALRLVGGKGDNPDTPDSQDERECRESRDILALAVALVRAVVLSGRMGTLMPQVGGLEVAAQKAAGIPLSMDEAMARYRARVGARCTAGSVLRMLSTIQRVSEWAGWQNVAQIDFASADAILSARLRGENGVKWQGSTHDQAVSTLRSFGEFLRKSGHVMGNPLLDLEPTGETAGEGSRPLSEAHARAFIEVSIDRHMRSRRAKGCAPLVWLTLFYTGLRRSEGRSMCWRSIVTDEESGPLIVTEPGWTGNKSGDKDWLPIRADLYDLLMQHRETVPHGADDPVFPKYPSCETWHVDREAAGIPEDDPRSGPCTTHSTRKSYGTWLDAQNIPRGLVSGLMRHSETLAERSYIRHNWNRSREAVALLPPLWPSGTKIFRIRVQKNVAEGNIRAMIQPSHRFPIPMLHSAPQLDQTDGPVTGIGSCVTTDLAGPGLSVQSSCNAEPRSESIPPQSSDDSRSNGQSRTSTSPYVNRSSTPDEVVAMELARWLTRRGSQEPPHGTDRKQ